MGLLPHIEVSAERGCAKLQFGRMAQYQYQLHLSLPDGAGTFLRRLPRMGNLEQARRLGVSLRDRSADPGGSRNESDCDHDGRGIRSLRAGPALVAWWPGNS